MTPKIVEQTKIFLQSDSDIPTRFARLEATDIPAIRVDLEDWTDNVQTTDAWEALDDKLINKLIRQRREELRVQKKRKVSWNSRENQQSHADRRVEKRNSV